MLDAHEPRVQGNPRRDREFEDLLRRATRFLQSHENRGLKEGYQKEASSQLNEVMGKKLYDR